MGNAKRRRSAAALLIGLLCLCTGLLPLPAGAAPALPLPADAAPALPLPLREAQFRAVAIDGPAPWSVVALPDTWSARRLPRLGRGHYRLQVHLYSAPTGVWALRIERLSTAYRVHVNGVLVQQPGGDDDASFAAQVLTKPVPVLVEFPATLLHAG